MSTRGAGRIGLISVGGTIVTSRTSRGDNLPQLPMMNLLAKLPKTCHPNNVHLLIEEQLSGRAVSPHHMCSFAHRINAAVSEGIEAVVVTSGTDTLEELAYALALQVPPEIPIVLTGAMRQFDEVGTDAVSNLSAAIQVAAHPELVGLGPLVVIHNEIHLARWVVKEHTTSFAAFSSPGLGAIGHFEEGILTLNAFALTKDYLGLPTEVNRRVDLVWVAAGSDGLFIDAAIPVTDGIVLAGTGGGHVPPAMIPAIERAISQQIPVVLSSRCMSGPVLRDTFSGPGSEIHLQGLGLHRAGNLAPLKARLRLLFGLSIGKKANDVFPT